MLPLSRSWASLTVLLLLFLITAGAQPVFQYDNDRLRVLNCPVALNGEEPPSGCDASSYEVTRFTWVAPSIIGAVAVLIFFVSYFVGKYACNCCGGRRQSANFCIPHPHLPAKYSKDDLLRPVFLAALCTVLFATSCIWGCSSTTTLLHAVGELDQRVGATVQQLNGFIHTSTTAMNAMTAYNATTQQTEVTSLAKVAAAHGITSSAPALAHTSSAVAELLEAMWGSTTTTLRRRVDHFVWAIYVLQILLLLVSMVGLLVAVFHCRQYVSMIMVVVFCALGGLMWLALGFNLSLDFLLRDSCAEVEYFGTQAANVVSSASGCNQTLLATYPLAYATASQELVQASCRTMLPFCYVAPVEDGIFQLKVLNCPEDMLAALENPSQACNSSLSIGTWRTWMRTSFTITSDITNNPTFAGVAKQLGAHCINGGPEVVCNIDACANQCLQQPSQEPSLLARAAREVLSYHQVLQRLTYVQATSVATLGTCIGVLELAVPPIIHTCTQVVAASDRVRQACGLAALVVLLSIMAFVLGAKRFMPLRQALLPQTN